MLVGLMGEHAQEVQRVGIIGLVLQDPPVQDLGLAQAAGLVVLQGGGQRLCRPRPGRRFVPRRAWLPGLVRHQPPFFPN